MAIKRKRLLIYSVNIGGTPHRAEMTEEEKDIGVTIDSKLEFNRHINEKVNKANRIMAVIRRAFSSLDEANFLPLNIQLRCW